MTCREAFAKAEEMISRGIRVKVWYFHGTWHCEECAK